MSGRRVPPGRAGRLWLARRLASADRGADVMDRKLRVLRQEQQRLRLLVTTTSLEWTSCCQEAERWLLRASLLGGQRSLRAAAVGPTAQVTLTWRLEMGVRYPDAADCLLPEPLAAGHAPGNSAIVRAEMAHRTALLAAVRHACALQAARTLDAEVAATQRRLRALTDRVVPETRELLRLLLLDLEQSEHEDTLRMRWVADHPATGRGRA